MKNSTNLKEIRRKKIHYGVRNKISGSSAKPRLSVYRSNKGVYAQLIDDIDSKTLVSASYREKGLDSKGTKTDVSKRVGLILADKAKKLKIEDVVFDRSGYLYHGIVKALADGAREGGLKF